MTEVFLKYFWNKFSHFKQDFWFFIFLNSNNFYFFKNLLGKNSFSLRWAKP